MTIWHYTKDGEIPNISDNNSDYLCQILTEPEYTKEEYIIAKASYCINGDFAYFYTGALGDNAKYFAPKQIKRWCFLVDAISVINWNQNEEK